MAVRHWLRWARGRAETDLDAQVNVYNLGGMLARPPAHYDFLRIDSNNTCNVHCVYCHNHRSADRVALETLALFLADSVLSVRHIQVGCVMEPTLDERLGDLLMLVRRRRPPERALILQTNGILLHLHDPRTLSEAGISRLAVSIDSADPQIHKALRGGTSLGKVGGNVRRFRQACPAAEVHFVTTVTRLNLSTIEGLVEFGLDLGVSRFVLREVFYHPENDVVDHSRMPELTLRPGEYDGMAEMLASRFSGRAEFEFADDARLARAESKMRNDSLRSSAEL